MFGVFSIISAHIRVSELSALRESLQSELATLTMKARVALCVVRAICGLGLAVASPAGFGIIGSTIHQEPARTIVFSAFGLGAPIGGGVGYLIGGAVAGLGG